MRVLALDVDGVLLDADRGGDGHWSNELTRRFGIERSQMREHFFAPHWADVVTGREPIEPILERALRRIGTDHTVEEVLDCWFETDFMAIEPAFDLARAARTAGIAVVLATNQEHRRATYLRERIGSLIGLDAVLYSADLGVEKRDPVFFELASERLGVDDPSAVLFVDDTLANVEVARSGGWQARHAIDDRSWIDAVSTLLGI